MEFRSQNREKLISVYFVNHEYWISAVNCILDSTSELIFDLNVSVRKNARQQNSFCVECVTYLNKLRYRSCILQSYQILCT